MIQKTLSIQSYRPQELIDITSDINGLIEKEQIKNGFCIVFVTHTTAAVTINEGADPDVKHDILTTLAALIPLEGSYRHTEGNSDAHIKTSLLGSSEFICIKNGELLLGTWQHVFLFEGDGPRKRKIIIHLFNEM